MQNNQLPHYKAFTRLKKSNHGVGVFAIQDIQKGEPIFYGDEDAEIIWVNKSELVNISPAIKKMYDDFCIIRNNGNEYGCPKNFNLMTISWYLNDSKEPNVICDKNYIFSALRNIREGEELTIDYDTYSERI
jgi:uncharacterized protein